MNDASRLKIFFPFGELEKGEWSFMLPKACADEENSMIYSADMGIGKVAAIRIDQAMGDMKTLHTLDSMTNTLQPTHGPKDQRVLVLTNMKKNVPQEPNNLEFFTDNYKEQVTFHNAATGKKLAESSFFEPLTPNSLVLPAFGGRCYFPTRQRFFTLQVMPTTAKAER